MSRKILTFIFTIFGLFFIVGQAASAQEVRTERAVTSDTVRIWLPSGAEKITDETVPAALAEMLERVVRDAGAGKLKQYNPQFLVWKGAEFKKSGGAGAIVKNLTEKISKMEYQFAARKPENGLTVFRIDDPATGKIVLGFYLAADDGLLWAWTQVYTDDGAK